MIEEDETDGGSVIAFRPPVERTEGRASDDEQGEARATSQHTLLVQSVDGGWVMDIRHLSFEAKVLQGKAFLASRHLEDARIFFECARQQDGDLPGIYLRIIDLLEIPDQARVRYLALLKEFTEDIIADVDRTYLRNFTSVQFQDLIGYYVIITQFGFNVGHLDRDTRLAQRDALVERSKELVGCRVFEEVEVIGRATIADLKHVAHIT